MKLHLKLNNNNRIYTNANSYLSYRSMGIKFYTITGRRGTGKTTTWLIQGFNAFNKDGSQFVYIRRYKTEMSGVVGTRSFDKIVDGIDYKPAAKGVAGFYCEDKIVGYGLTLSMQASLKSLNFDKVKLIIFDEAILQRGSPYRYLKDEVTNLLNLIHTIVRNRDDYVVVILGNDLDIFNPYYAYFGVPKFTGRYIDKKRHLLCDDVQPSEELVKLMKSTDLYALTEGTTYGDFAFDGKTLVTKEATIIEKPKNSSLVFRLVMNDITLNCFVYYSNELKEQRMYVEIKNKVIMDNYTYVIMQENKPNYLYVMKFKAKYKAYLFTFLFRDKVEYNDYKGSTLLMQVADEI